MRNPAVDDVGVGHAAVDGVQARRQLGPHAPGDAGQCRLDLVGTDLTLAIHDTVLPAIEARPRPSPYLENLVADGKFGMKSGEGFRTWSAEEQSALRSTLVKHLKTMRGR